nr:unnamed protein product [Spirometra erinaceieuropaei]
MPAKCSNQQGRPRSHVTDTEEDSEDRRSDLRIAAAKAKRQARKSHLRPPRNANAQPPPTCPRCPRISCAPSGFVGHLRINCTTWTALTVVFQLTFYAVNYF